MKKLFLALGLALISVAFTSCHQKELEELRMQNEILQTEVNNKDAELDSVFAALNEIEDNLAQVSAQYGAVQELTVGGEGNANVRGKIKSQISSIESILADNKAKIASLSARVGAANRKNKELQEYVSKLETRIAEQEQQIADLQAELENKNATIKTLNQNVADLTAANEEKDHTIAQKIAQANRAYYIVGSYKDLKTNGIIRKLGVLKKTQSTSNDMETSLFTEIDRTQVSTITVNAKKAKVISRHPEASYELVMDENNSSVVAFIRILDVNAFWKYTDYLVISTK